MPEPGRDPQWPRVRRTALIALFGGLAISALKFSLFVYSNSAVVLSDALESLVNIAAAGVMLVSLAYADRPPDREHRYGHGNAQFMAIAFEGAMVLFAGMGIIAESVRRFAHPEPIHELEGTILALGAIAILVGLLGAGVYLTGRRLDNRVLKADGLHLLSDLATTAGALIGLMLVRATGVVWIDSASAVVLGVGILLAGWRLVRESFAGLMDRASPEDLAAVTAILNEEREAGVIEGFHKVRVRRSGNFPWIDMHIQVVGAMRVADAHEIASRIEGRIERALGGGDATAHLEPDEDGESCEGE